jgi:hypothetical protein
LANTASKDEKTINQTILVKNQKYQCVGPLELKCKTFYFMETTFESFQLQAMFSAMKKSWTYI